MNDIGNIKVDSAIAGWSDSQRVPPDLGLSTSPRRSASSQIAESGGPSASLRRDTIFRRALVLADLIAILGTLLIITAISNRSLRLTWIAYVGVLAPLLVIKLIGLYDRDETLLRKTTLDEVPKLFQVATLYALGAWLAGSLVVKGGLDRRDAVFLWLVTALAMMSARAAARAIALRVTPAERCLFIGDSLSAAAITTKLAEHRGGVKAELIAQLDIDSGADRWSSDTFSGERLDEIRGLARELDVHRAIIAPTSADGGEMLDLVRTLKAVGVRVSILPRLLEVVGSAVVFDDLHGLTVMGVRRFDLTRSSATVKRTFDLCGAIVGLIALSPLMAAITLAIILDSQGPILFRQSRVGRYGRRFDVYKFRTMIPDAEALKDSLRDRNEAQGGLFKIAEDPRITRVGAFLRKSSLDELPQLLNIVRGEMSLVGPRPLVIEEDQRIEGWQRRRLALMPGMTGHWQILGPARVPLSEMVSIDYLYVANWTLWSDVKILLRTVPHVLGGRGL